MAGRRDEQIGLLTRRLGDYGRHEDDALDIATRIRVLIHDTPKSSSVLGPSGTNELAAMSFPDVRKPDVPEAYSYITVSGPVDLSVATGIPRPYVGLAGEQSPTTRPLLTGYRSATSRSTSTEVPTLTRLPNSLTGGPRPASSVVSTEPSSPADRSFSPWSTRPEEHTSIRPRQRRWISSCPGISNPSNGTGRSADTTPAHRSR